MNNDIKEIKITFPGQILDYVDTKEHLLELFNYITNLQEEIEDLKRILGIWNNRKLIKKFNKEYDKEDKNKNPNRDYAVIYPDAEEVYKRYYDYKSRNEKAIEYIRKNFDEDRGMWIVDMYELLDILQEEDYNKVERAYLDDEWIGEDKDVKD